jgi:Zn-dependent alcohol dehydrogenase
MELRAIDRPVPKASEVLVRVHAAGLDRGVWHVMTGLPYMIRFIGFGVRRPKVRVRGMDLAGRVEAVGEQVTRFRPGDAVFGWADGSYAEYASVPEDHLAPMPASIGFEQAAAVPISGFAALQAVRDEGEVQPGQKVLVIGAAGGVGVVRGPAGQGVRRRGHRGGRHGPAGAGRLDRRRRRDRLHRPGRHRREAPLGRHPRHRRPPAAVPAAAGPHAAGDTGHRRQ